ncbi:hypothetical protein TorRG33x02_008100 [Trema orientale]|uniref:Uncharacterized protein n=1 Tax=Trema orientale TaxID=63057 RepID=A0A2P5G0P5_TREOI|nr:hypothetical protein TorRG33x02_008100 [Trema orientale]
MVKDTQKNLNEQVESDLILRDIDDYKGENEVTFARTSLSDNQTCSLKDILLSRRETWGAKNVSSRFSAHVSPHTCCAYSELILCFDGMLPLHKYFVDALDYLQVTPTQLTPSG